MSIKSLEQSKLALVLIKQPFDFLEVKRIAPLTNNGTEIP